MFAGAAAVAVPVSPWLSAFSLFIFLTLAIVKRQTEMRALPALPDEEGDRRPPRGGRGYLAQDAVVLTALAAASTLASAVVLALYLQSAETGARYQRPELLWAACPLLVCWLGRMVLLANRGLVDADPVLFALRDRVTWLTAAGFAAAFAAAL